MNLAIEFNPAAFKHGVSEADIRLVFDTAKYDGFLDEDDPDAEDKYLVIGFDRKANLIEVFYNVIAEDRLRVFHAMKCRSAFIRLLERRKNERFDR
ncbi:MAG: hypothetical protein LBG26_07085 [Treponema sp.]|jgi:uncharacterized DUF497 family protein|nr:hypothetical protein [Treponema sp.]